MQRLLHLEVMMVSHMISSNPQDNLMMALKSDRSVALLWKLVSLSVKQGNNPSWVSCKDKMKLYMNID